MCKPRRRRLNTASAPLLSYISGITSAIAKNIVAYREEQGRFETRKQLLKVAKLGPKAFEQMRRILTHSKWKKSTGHNKRTSRKLRGSRKTPEKTRNLPPKISAPVNWQAYPSPSKTTKNSQKNWKSEKSHCATS